MIRVLKIFAPYSLLVGVGIAIWVSNRPFNSDTSETETHELVDPVCHMEVAETWGHEAEYENRRYLFCTDACRDRFLTAPSEFLGDRCVVCSGLNTAEKVQSATYLGKSYRLCSVEHRKEFKADPASFFMHSMWGIPNWLYYISVAVVLLAAAILLLSVKLL